MKPFLSLENNLRKLFDRTGAAFDRWRHKDTAARPTPRALADRLSPVVQKTIDNSLEENEKGIPNIAPHRIVVMLDYNTFSQLEQPELRALKQELEQVAREHIINRRYNTKTRANLTVSYDPLVAAPSVRADFGQAVAAAAVTDEAPYRTDISPSGRLSFRLRSAGPRIALDTAVSKLRPAGKPVTIGRGRDNDVVIDDKSVSKFHATLAVTKDGKLIVSDIGSTNGTYVNNQPVKGRAVVDLGDIITFGEVDVRLEI